MDIERKLADISLKEEHSNDGKAAAANATGARGSAGSESDSTESEMRERFMKLVTDGRKYAEEGDIATAIRFNEEALAIRFSEKLKKRIEKMKVFLAEQEEEEGEDDNEAEDGDMKSLGQGFKLHRKLCTKLYQHQKEGVLWMWSLYLLGKGGILADDMGLGKTIQMIAFLAGMFDMDKIKCVLIVVPLSVIPNWLNEFNKWTPGINIIQYHGRREERERALARVRSRGGVLVTTYGTVCTTHKDLSQHRMQRFVWDYVILDEGHKIKNPTKTSKSVNAVPARIRMILTGTPVQNNLKELWSLFDYVHQGTLLGTMRTFKLEFETPIVRARERDATQVAKKLGQEMAETLKGIIKPYFLRRTKAEVSAAAASDDSDCMKMPTMTRKNDLVIWLHLAEAQQKIYKDFINLDSIKMLLMTKKSPLVALTVLKKICDHPRLLSKRACMQLGLDGEDYSAEDLEHPEAYESAVLQLNNISDDVLVGEAGKMKILVELLDTFKAEGRKTLVFSQSCRMLDIIQKVITNRGHKCSRLDGKVTQLAERDRIVTTFQKDPSYTAFLLTVQVGGVGLTITSADRVIIYDPNWNPATDAQAVDRAYRIGQQNNVVVYRLITCGTVEEKIYRRQVFKDSITRQTTGGSKNPYRYFTSMELRELFALDDPMFSTTQRQLQDMHAGQRKTDTDLDEHIAFLHSLDIFGISDHDLMFQQTEQRDDEEENDFVGDEEKLRDQQFIRHKIYQAQTLIAGESENPFAEYEQRSKAGMKYPPTARPAQSGSANVPTSSLFSHVGPVEILESDEEEENSGFKQEENNQYFIKRESETTSESSNGRSVGNSTADAIDLTEMEGDDDHNQDADDRKQMEALKEVFSPPKKMHRLSVGQPDTAERRVLQALSPQEVRMRSPTVVHSGRKGPIVSEELLISPDVTSPVIGLEKIDLRRRMLEEEEDERRASGSLPSSPRRPMSPGTSPLISGHQRPLSKLASSPGRSVNSPQARLHQLLAASSPSPASPLAAGRRQEAILEADTPQSSENQTPGGSRDSAANSSSARLSINDTLDSSASASPARRKLSFVPESPNMSFSGDQSALGNSPLVASPVLKPGQKRSSFLESPVIKDGGDSNPSPLRHVSNSSPVKQLLFKPSNSPQQLSTSPGGNSLLASPAAGELNRSARKKNKRRSVCVEKPRQAHVLSESSGDDEFSAANVQGSDLVSSDCDENKENASLEEEEEEGEGEVEVIKGYISSDEENKENDAIGVKRAGGRNRILSESESSDGSCYEVPVSEEEDTQNSDGDQDDAPEEEEKEEEEENELTEEDYERFQELVSNARQLYKRKNYEDSLLFVEEALQLCQEPALEEMANKIRLRIAEQQTNASL